MLNNVVALLGVGGGATTAYESIATVTVGAGGTGSVTFSSIPSTYKHLQIRGLARDNDIGSNPSNGLVRLNSDSGSSYACHWLYGDGATAGAGAGTSLSRIYNWVMGGGASANVFGAEIYDILDYANTNKYKTTRFLSAGDNNGNGRIFFTSGLWQSTAAVNTITIYPSASLFSQYTTYALYGIKG